MGLGHLSASKPSRGRRERGYLTGDPPTNESHDGWNLELVASAKYTHVVPETSARSNKENRDVRLHDLRSAVEPNNLPQSPAQGDKKSSPASFVLQFGVVRRNVEFRRERWLA